MDDIRVFAGRTQIEITNLAVEAWQTMRLATIATTMTPTNQIRTIAAPTLTMNQMQTMWMYGGHDIGCMGEYGSAIDHAIQFNCRCTMEGMREGTSFAAAVTCAVHGQHHRIYQQRNEYDAGH